MGDFFTYASLIGVVLLGGLLVFFLKEKITKYLKYILAFSGAFMLSIAVLHIIPEVYMNNGFSIGIFVLFGFLIQLILEYFSQGIEHGHFHVHGTKSLYFLTPILISLCFHAFLEGLPLAKEFVGHHGHNHSNDHGDSSFLISILLHKFPIAIALMTLFLKAKLKMSLAFLWLIVFALMAPLGNLTGTFFQEFFIENNSIFEYILAIVLGMFLHISTTILFESDESHKFNLLKLMIIIIGGGLAYLIV
ncbi:ZIP family metal transporter [Flavobacteriales bacterium]|nr:ZIP family metal transporter [Flavobacteriales bacterium]